MLLINLMSQCPSWSPMVIQVFGVHHLRSCNYCKYIHQSHQSYYKVGHGPNVVTLLYRTSIYSWVATWQGAWLRMDTKKTCVIVRLDFVLKIYRFKSEHKWKGLCHHLRRKKVVPFTLIYIFYTLTPESTSGTCLGNQVHDSQLLTGWANFRAGPQWSNMSLKLEVPTIASWTMCSNFVNILDSIIHTQLGGQTWSIQEKVLSLHFDKVL